MKRYGIMGGTFNPIHLAHIYIAYEAKEALELDKVIFLPSGNPPHKKGNKIIDAKYRFDMVKYAIQDYEGFTIDDYEIKNSGYSYNSASRSLRVRRYRILLSNPHRADNSGNLFLFPQTPDPVEDRSAGRIPSSRRSDRGAFPPGF